MTGQDVGLHDDMMIEVMAETTEAMAGTTDAVAVTTETDTLLPRAMTTGDRVDTTIDRDMTTDHGTIDTLETIESMTDLREMTDHPVTNSISWCIVYTDQSLIRALVCFAYATIIAKVKKNFGSVYQQLVLIRFSVVSQYRVSFALFIMILRIFAHCKLCFLRNLRSCAILLEMMDHKDFHLLRVVSHESATGSRGSHGHQSCMMEAARHICTSVSAQGLLKNFNFPLGTSCQDATVLLT